MVTENFDSIAGLYFIAENYPPDSTQSSEIGSSLSRPNLGKIPCPHPISCVQCFSSQKAGLCYVLRTVVFVIP